MFPQISVPRDYQVWYETMCAEFPTRFGRLFRGPMWRSVPSDLQKDPLTVSQVTYLLLQTCCNRPFLDTM